MLYVTATNKIEVAATDWRGRHMSEAMELIVDSYVKLGSIKALEDMLDHRRKVARQLQFRSISGFDLSMLTTTIGKEIALIEEGIERINRPLPQPAVPLSAVHAQGVEVAGTIRSVAAVQSNEAANSLVGAAIERQGSRPKPEEGGAVQVRGVTIEAAPPGRQSNEAVQTPLFDEYSLGGRIGYKW